MLRISALRSVFLTRVPYVHLLSKILARLELLASCFVFIAFSTRLRIALSCSYLRRFDGLSVMSLRIALAMWQSHIKQCKKRPFQKGKVFLDTLLITHL